MKCPNQPCRHHHARDIKPAREPSRPPKKGRPKAEWCTHAKGAKSADAIRQAFALTTSAVSPMCGHRASRSTLPWTITNTRETALILARPAPTPGPIRTRSLTPAHQSRCLKKLLLGRLHAVTSAAIRLGLDCFEPFDLDGNPRMTYWTTKSWKHFSDYVGQES